MKMIIPHLIGSEPAQLEEVDSENSPSPGFKELIDEISSSTDSPKNPQTDEETKDEDLNCPMISIFELPRSHFRLPEEEEDIQEINEIARLFCSRVPNTLMTTAVPSSSSENTSGLSSQPVQTSAEIEALFEKMVGTMLVLSSSNESETTVFVDAPQFDRSPFYGTRITIKEFSTAPKAFNIEIASSMLALNVINAHKSALLTAFAKGDFNFSIARFDAEILQENRPLFHRKESVSQDQEGL